MNRSLWLTAAGALLLTALPLHAEAARTRTVLPPFEPAVDLATVIDRLRALDTRATFETEDGVSAPAGAMDVYIARVDAEGNITYSCVDAAEATRLLHAAPTAAPTLAKVAGQ